jgi:hypothetical protein
MKLMQDAGADGPSMDEEIVIISAGILKPPVGHLRGEQKEI